MASSPQDINPFEKGLHSVLHLLMARDAELFERVFKTAWFSKAAKKTSIRDAELCSAIRQVMLGQADDLGGGVFKKRLGKNQYRSIILAKGGRHWVYAYLFAKQDRANIDDRELKDLREFASLLARKTEAEISTDLNFRQLEEICHERW